MAEIESRAIKRDRNTTVGLTVFCQSFQALSVGGLALLLPLVRQDLGLSFTQGGSLAAATTIVYAFMQIPMGYLSDQFSPKRLFIIGLLGTVGLSLTLGLVTNYWQALVNQTVAGFFRALLFSPGMALLTGWFHPNRRATATGLYLVGGATGNVFFNLVGPLLVAAHSWRFAFIFMSSIGIIAILFLMKFGKESPRTIERQKVKINITEIWQLFRFRIMQICGGIQFIRFAVLQSITFWLPSLLVNEKGLSLQTCGTIIALQAVIMASSVVVGGYISDKLKNPILVIGVSLSVICITSILIISTFNIGLIIILVALNALFLNMYFGPLFSLPIGVLGVNKAGISTGFGNFFASLGAFVTTYLLGALKDSTGAFKTGFWLVSILCVAGLVLTLFLWRTRRQTSISPDSA
jgi:sugar phosphate permease